MNISTRRQLTRLRTKTDIWLSVFAAFMVTLIVVGVLSGLVARALS